MSLSCSSEHSVWSDFVGCLFCLGSTLNLQFLEIYLSGNIILPVNRNLRLPLATVWQHYWGVLFPEVGDWRKDLEAEILKRLLDPRDDHNFGRLDEDNEKGRENANLQLLHWRLADKWNRIIFVWGSDGLMGLTRRKFCLF